jgi:uracil-DNA glycosylase
MDSGPQSTLREELEAAFGWWRDAGVDCDFADEPTDWLAATPMPPEPVRQEPERKVAETRAAPPAPPRICLHATALPDTLGAFTRWWMSEPALDGGRTSGRVPPRGPQNAELMILVPEPEREDRDMLLSGSVGALLANMLLAMGIAQERAYVASALPRHLPGADWREIAASGIGAAVRRHIVLAAPKRLIAFGGNILPLIQNDLPQETAVLRKINLEGQSISLLAARDLAAIRERARWKASLWNAWLGWTGQA